MERLLEARSDEEASKLLQECGYPGAGRRPAGGAWTRRCPQAREALLADLGDSAPDPRYIDIFKLKYDYHNAKAVLKAAAVGTDPARMLMDMGRVPRVGAEERHGEQGTGRRCPDLLPEAVAEAKNVLDTTRDPQLSDIALDRWMYRDMAQTGGAHRQRVPPGLRGRPRSTQPISARLIRTLRMGKSAEFLRGRAALTAAGSTRRAAGYGRAERGSGPGGALRPHPVRTRRRKPERRP